MAIHPSVGPVSRVYALLKLAGAAPAYRYCDLVFLDGLPYVVIAWDEWPDGDRPAITTPLDTQFLQPINWPDAQHMYELPIGDPRQLD